MCVWTCSTPTLDLTTRGRPDHSNSMGNTLKFDDCCRQSSLLTAPLTATALLTTLHYQKLQIHLQIHLGHGRGGGDDVTKITGDPHTHQWASCTDPTFLRGLGLALNSFKFKFRIHLNLRGCVKCSG